MYTRNANNSAVIEPVENLTVTESRARGRTDVPFDAERCEAQLTGSAPVLPDGRLAW